MDAYIIMSKKETRYAEVLQKVIAKSISQKEGAKTLSVTTRHLRRLEKRFRKDGIAGLVHRNRGKRSNRKIPEEKKTAILKLLRDFYADFGPTFASEKLKEDHDFDYDPKTIRSLMIEAGLWMSKGRKKEAHRFWRERRACLGDLIQYDGSYERWFEDRGPKSCLLASIDDATGAVTQAFFAEHEGTEPTFAFWRSYLETHGKPRSIYVDKFSTYSMNHKIAKENGDTLTQFGRAMRECGVEIILANSPQAKGRVERLFGTLQDRLIKELRLNGISTPEEANRFLEKTFLPAFNARFAVVPRESANLHVRLTKKERNALPAIFSRQYERIVRNDFTLAYGKEWYQLSEKQPVTVFKGDTVTVEEHQDSTVHFRLHGTYLHSSKLPVRPKKVRQASVVLSPRSPHRPAADHPWRKFDFSHSSKEIVRSGHF